MRLRIPTNVDVAVIGAGTAGCSAAIPPAREGLNVLLVEKTRACDVGSKVCGNAISAQSINEVAGHVAPPSGLEIAAELEGGTAYVAENHAGTFVSVHGLVLNRVLFGQRLLSDAVSAGVHLADGMSCVGWTDRKSGCIRVRSEEGDEIDVTARIAIDASGFRSVLARSGGPSRPDATLRSEVGVGYREVLVLRQPLNVATGGFIVMSPPGARHGYAWVFPMGGSLANVGVGRTLEDDGSPLKSVFDAFTAGRPELAGAETVSAGAGMLPMRRPLDSLVGDGFMAVGDAGCQASPLHGGGIAPSVVAGVMAGEQAVHALGEGDASAAGLWGYSVRYMRGLGAAYAAHEQIRHLIFSLPSSDLALLASEYVKADALVRAVSTGNLLPTMLGGLGRLVSLAGRPTLVARVLRASRAMAAIRQHYTDYPETPRKLESWVGRATYLRRSFAQ
ncbi:MAG: NAD(P)/FAD-dependent oxidoreductase [Candidatus Eisenbacteria bacterium]|nr:NAD(P)/FAD-dependent oxidoreductase [Candidatus Eisenbacteria bacterium]